MPVSPITNDSNENTPRQPMTIGSDGLLDLSAASADVQGEYGSAIQNYLGKFGDAIDSARERIERASRSGNFSAAGLLDEASLAKAEAAKKIEDAEANFGKFIQSRAGEAIKAVNNFQGLPLKGIGSDGRLLIELRGKEVREELTRPSDNDVADAVLPTALAQHLGELAMSLSPAEGRYLRAAAEGDEDVIRGVQTATRLWKQRHLRPEVIAAGVSLYYEATDPHTAAKARTAESARAFLASNGKLARTALAKISTTGSKRRQASRKAS